MAMAMSGVALDRCSLLSLFVESVLWGLCLSLCMITVFLLIQKKSNIVKHVPHLAFVTVICVLCTMHVGLSFVRVADAFLRSTHPVIFLEDVTNKNYRFKYGVLFVLVFLGDLLIVFRSFMLWNKNYFIALFPIFTTVGTLVAAGGALQSMKTVSNIDLEVDSLVQSWLTASFTLALVTKAICLFLVMFRVQQIHASITANVNRHITVYTLLVVLVESGALTLVASLLLLPTFVLRRNAHYILCDALSPITGITVAAIIAGMTINLSTPTPPAARPTWSHHTAPLSPVPPARHVSKKSHWNDDFEDEIDSPSATISPVLSRTNSIHNANQSTGTLNMAIVI